LFLRRNAPGKGVDKCLQESLAEGFTQCRALKKSPPEYRRKKREVAHEALDQM